MTADEIRFLLDQGSTLVFFRDRWIEVDRGILKEALRALEKGVDKKANPLTFAMGLGHVGLLELEEVKTHGWLRGLVNELRNCGVEQVERVEIEGFEGELRDYQKRGVEWLEFLTSHGFGARPHLPGRNRKGEEGRLPRQDHPGHRVGLGFSRRGAESPSWELWSGKLSVSLCLCG